MGADGERVVVHGGKGKANFPLQFFKLTSSYSLTGNDH